MTAMDDNENEEVMVSDPVPMPLSDEEKAAIIVGDDHVIEEHEVEFNETFTEGDAHLDGPDA